MTLHGFGEVTTQDIGAALSQAGTILNPGTYTTTYGGGVLYTPSVGANVPGGLPGGAAAPLMIGSTPISPMMILLAVGAFFAFSGGKR